MQELRFVSSGPALLFGSDGLRQVPGGVEGSMTLGPWSTGDDGRTAVGALGVMVDEVLGYSIMASLRPGEWSISTEIWIDVVGRLSGRAEKLSACARPVRAGSFATGEVRDAMGRVVVECRQRGRAAPPPVELALRGPRPSPEGWAAQGLGDLLDLRADGDAAVMHFHPGLANPRQMLHGGVSLAASEVVATRSRVSSGCRLPTSSVHIVHTRGIALGASVVFHPETRHAGRTLWVTDVVGTVDGKACTFATVTAQE